MSSSLLCALFLATILLTHAVPASLSLEFSPDYSAYSIRINNQTWLQSGETSFRSNNEWAALRPNTTANTKGHDSFGDFNQVTLTYSDSQSLQPRFAAHFRSYPSHPDKIVFTQSFLADISSTKDQLNGIISSFPSFLVAQPKHDELGYVHFGGHFTAFLEPQFGVWSSSDNATEVLYGGLMETGPMAIFNRNLSECLVISALTGHMATNDNVTTLLDRDDETKQMRWGIQGGVDGIPKGYSVSFLLSVAEGGVNAGMKHWGDLQLSWHGKKQRGDAHARDYSLNYLGYSTDHGAYYYYYTEPNKTYQDTVLDIHAYHEQSKIPTRYILLDSWWYYRGAFGGVSNWTAMPSVLPKGLEYLYAQTGWKVVAHNRYWSPDNVYQAQYNFTKDLYDALPLDYVFWDDLFSNNSDWGLMVYEQDWLSQQRVVADALHFVELR